MCIRDRLYPSQPRWCCTSAACDRQRYCVKCSTAPCRIHGRPLWRDPEAPHRLTARVHAGRLARYVSDGVAAAGLTDMNFVGSAELLRRAFHHYDSMPCIGVVASEEVVWQSFAETGAAAERVAAELRTAVGDEAPGVAMIAAKNSVEWVLVDVACVYVGAPSAAIDATLATETAVACGRGAAAEIGQPLRAAYVDADRAHEYEALGFVRAATTGAGLRGLALGSGARPGLARAAGAAALKAAGGTAPYDEAVWRAVAERLTERR